MKSIYYFDTSRNRLDPAIPPPVDDVEHALRDEEGNPVVLIHGDVVNFNTDRYKDAYFVLETYNGREWVRNPDLSGSGYLTVPNEITCDMEDAIAEYSDIMTKLDGDFTAIYLAGDDIYLDSYPQLRNEEEHQWRHKGVEVIEGVERPMTHLLTFTKEYGPVLHIETRKSYMLTFTDDDTSSRPANLSNQNTYT